MKRISVRDRKAYQLGHLPWLSPAETLVLKTLRADCREWYTAAELAALTGLSVQTARVAARQLYRDLELVEDDGHGTRAVPPCWLSLDRRSWGRVQRRAEYRHSLVGLAARSGNRRCAHCGDPVARVSEGADERWDHLDGEQRCPGPRKTYASPK